MRYREVGDTGIEVSVLGFGTMRYKSGENAAEIIHRGLELGMNYFDIGSAYSWDSYEENAETWTGRAIKDVNREDVVLSAKAQVRPGEERHERAEANIGIRNRDEMWMSIENSLDRVGVDYFDFYQFWDLSKPEDFETARNGDDSPLQAMREAQEQGLVKHLGFTSHAQADEIISWLNQVPDFRTITVYYNFLGRYCEKVLDYAQENDIGVKIMGPLRGGLLTGKSEVFSKHLPELADAPVQEVAFRFLQSHPGISTILSGMNEIAHLEQNVDIVSSGDMMSEDQRDAFIEAFQEFSKGQPLCTGCRYCLGACPQNLAIYQLMGLYQASEIFGLENARQQIENLSGENKDPSRCVDCEECIEVCPQSLPIAERMDKLAEIIG
ncbi:MAG: aldo/keto reductase [Planctomycetes bacterium]|nr:aldo/keto reductase [Planctomycetota bacterium]